MSEREALKDELNYWLRVIGDRMGANDRRFSDMVRDLKDAIAPTQQPSTLSGFYTDDNGTEWLCVERGGKVDVAQADKATTISRDLFEQWGWEQRSHMLDLERCPAAIIATERAND